MLVAEADSKQENRALSAAHSEDGKQSCGRGSLSGAARRKALSEEGPVLDLSDGREPALRGAPGPGERPLQRLRPRALAGSRAAWDCWAGGAGVQGSEHLGGGLGTHQGTRWALNVAGHQWVYRADYP